MSTSRLTPDMSIMQAAEAVAGTSRRAHEIAIAVSLHAANIDPDHFLGAFSALYDLDHFGIYDDKIVDLFDRVCCGCHVNLRTRLRARSLGLVGEEGFWAPDLSVEHYLKKVRRCLPRFAKGMAIITARQQVAPVQAPTPEQVAESVAILDAANACLGITHAEGTKAGPAEATTGQGRGPGDCEVAETGSSKKRFDVFVEGMERLGYSVVSPPADPSPRYQARRWMPRHESEQAEAHGPVRATPEEAERDLVPWRGNVMEYQPGDAGKCVLHKYVYGQQWESITPPAGFVLS